MGLTPSAAAYNKIDQTIQLQEEDLAGAGVGGRGAGSYSKLKARPAQRLGGKRKQAASRQD